MNKRLKNTAVVYYSPQHLTQCFEYIRHSKMFVEFNRFSLVIYEIVGEDSPRSTVIVRNKFTKLKTFS